MVDEAGSGTDESKLPSVEESKRKRRERRGVGEVIPRKHLLTTVYKKEVSEKLDKLHADGHTILSITASDEIRGFEIVSYLEE